MTIKIVTDSSCDLPPDVITEHGISVIPLYINVGEKSYRDGIDISHHQFYNLLPQAKLFPTTSAPGVEVFNRLFSNLIQAGATGIISIHITQRLSNTIDIARLAARELHHSNIVVFDSGQLSLGVGVLAVVAARLASSGASMKEIVAALEIKKKATYTMAVLDTVEYLKRSGRLSMLQYGIASLLQIKPIIKMHDGIMELERIRTSNHSFERIVQLARSLAPFEELAFVHTNAREKARLFHNKLKDLIPISKKIMVQEVTPVIGAHVGPGGYGFSLIRKTTD